MKTIFWIDETGVLSATVDDKVVIPIDTDFVRFEDNIYFTAEKVAQQALSAMIRLRYNPFIEAYKNPMIRGGAAYAGYKVSNITLHEFRKLIGLPVVAEITISDSEFESFFQSIKYGILEIANENEPERYDHLKKLADTILTELSRDRFACWATIQKAFKQLFMLDYLDRKWMYTTIKTKTNENIKLVTENDFAEYKRVNAKYVSANMKRFVSQR